MSAAIHRLVADLLDAWNSHAVDRLRDLYAADYEGTDVGEAGRQVGPEAALRTFRRYLQAFPDLTFSREDAVVEGDRVALSWTAHGTHRGPLMSIPPTGREVTLRGMTLLTVADGKVRRGVHVWDVAGLLRSLGLLPEL